MLRLRGQKLRQFLTMHLHVLRKCHCEGSSFLRQRINLHMRYQEYLYIKQFSQCIREKPPVNTKHEHYDLV